jgi:hypothetical protein
VELQLLRQETRKKTIRFLLGGSFKALYPDITHQFEVLKARCPSLIETLLPPSARHFMEELEAGVTGTPVHVNPRVSGKLPGYYITDVEHVPTRPSPSREGDFDKLLRSAYARDYRRRNVFELGAKPYVYYQHVTFVDSQNEKRIGYTVGSYIELTPPDHVGPRVSESEPILARIDHIFTHELGETRAFVYVEILEETGEIDDICLFKIHKTTGRKAIWAARYSCRTPVSTTY